MAQSLVVAQPQKAKVEKEAKADWKLEVVPPTTSRPRADHDDDHDDGVPGSDLVHHAGSAGRWWR